MNKGGVGGFKVTHLTSLEGGTNFAFGKEGKL